VPTISNSYRKLRVYLFVRPPRTGPLILDELCACTILVDDDEPTLYEQPLKLIGARVVSSSAMGIDQN